MIELITFLVMTHITILCVTLYLHRGLAHKSLVFHPILAHFMRFWLWLTTGMVAKEWVAIHRRHHQRSDREGDPHSPHVFGITTVLFKGVTLYTNASRNKGLITQYGVGVPNDKIERTLYTPHHKIGILLLLVINTLLFNGWGIVMWLLQMAWIPFWAAGVVNGIGHWWGYRNGETNDQSRNFSPWGIVIGGEELHNNHHLSPASPKLSRRWFEFDIGWFWVQIFRSVGLLKLAH